MPTNDFKERWGRETRLLVLVVVVSLAVLFLLARFRFPSASLNVATSTPSPLGALASRATFDDLAGIMNTLLTRVSPRILVVEVAPEPEPASSGRSSGRAGNGGRGGRGEPKPTADTAPEAPHVLPALRVRSDFALVHLPAGFVLISISGAGAGPLDVVASDPKRELALIRVAPQMELRGELPTYGLTGFEYVAAIDAVSGGATLQPVFVGRIGNVADERWPGQVVALGRGPNIPAGSFVFAVDGRFLGLAVRQGSGTAVVPPSVLDAVVGEMARTGGGAP